jgi:hypothetical protein
MPDELDVALQVIEYPVDYVLPNRRPNVVSHRAHELLINVRILSLPADTTEITLRAYVIEYSGDRLGVEECAFSTATLWGINPGVTFPAPSPLPATLWIKVRELGADHLGQGPYGVIVNVEPSGGELLAAPAEVESGDAQAVAGGTTDAAGGGDESGEEAAGTPAEVTPGGINIIQDRTFYLDFISM